MPDEKLFKRREVMEEDALSKTWRGRRDRGFGWQTTHRPNRLSIGNFQFRYKTRQESPPPPFPQDIPTNPFFNAVETSHINFIPKNMASQAPSTPSGSQPEGPSTTGNLQRAHTVDPHSDDDISLAPPSLIPPREMVTCLECLTWIASGQRPAEICSFSYCGVDRNLNIPYLQCTRATLGRVDYARQIWEIYQQLDPAEQEFWNLLNEANSSDEEHPEYSEENPNGES
ncbi:hypothetical protein N7532_000883 [Penicillium argentinense]|uniref:Uncharacterized protein n=1 Tax=Penicillium argentinense TaxID=1131581 RepID=A0A9W9G670_9EURO|nr:uncharacterized protein N7532_000883 [Penicillium argentinense]KAJ5112838.1 hypothetical protein N7532_000883 [Penicillium argentinense]